jgi:hypothetical protein
VSLSKNAVREDADEIFRILVSPSHSHNASCLGTWMNTPNRALTIALVKTVLSANAQQARQRLQIIVCHT